jgi:hypothetical protein
MQARTVSASCATTAQATAKIARGTKRGVVRTRSEDSYTMTRSSSRWASVPVLAEKAVPKKRHHDFSAPRRHTSAPSLSYLQNVRQPVRSTDGKWNHQAAVSSIKQLSGDAPSSMRLSTSIDDSWRPVVQPVRRGSFDNMSLADIISMALDGLDPIDMD